jgi:hypothetical protein
MPGQIGQISSPAGTAENGLVARCPCQNQAAPPVTPGRYLIENRQRLTILVQLEHFK